MRSAAQVPLTIVLHINYIGSSSKAAKCEKVQLLLFRQAAMSGKGNNLMFLSFFFNKGSLNIFIALFFSNFSFTSMHTSEANT